MADVKKKARAQAKAYLTRAATNINRLLDLESEDSSDVLIEMCEFVIQDFEGKLRFYDDKQGNYELALDDEDAIAREIEMAADCRSQQTNVLVKIKETLNSLKKESVSVSSNSNVGRMDTSITSSSSVKPNHVSLPKLQLPHFTGEIIEFQSFWDKFVALIDKREDLCKVNKFSYLQSLLKGEAKSCLQVQGLALTEANYETAKEIMIRRFGKQEKVIVAHIQKLLNISAKETLWQIYDQVQVHVRSLANLGVSGENYGLVLTPMILHQLPPSVRLEWARSSEGKEGDVEHLLQFLFEDIQRRERSAQLDSGESTVSTDNRSKLHRQRFRPTGAALITTDKGGSKVKKCNFCEQGHFSDKCPTVLHLTHDQRKEKVKSMGLCFKCLSGKHRAAQCNKKCYFCQGSHHSVLHKYDGANNTTSTNSNSRPANSSTVRFDNVPYHPGPDTNTGSSRDVNTGANAGGPSFNSESTGGTYYSQSSASGRATLMQVVKTNIGGQSVTVFFDSGSDFSYIKKETARKLCLRETGETKGVISSFGGNLVEQDHQVYDLQIGGIRTTLLSLKTIASPFFRAPVPLNVLRQFKNIPLTEDLSHENVISVDILIGLDFYHEFMCPERMVVGGLVAQRTWLGWMLSGSYMYNSFGAVRSGLRMQTSLFSGSFVQPSEATIRKFWELDSVGILGEGKQENEAQCLERFNQGVSFTGERYRVGLPWKSGDLKEQLDNNECASRRRLVALDRKLSFDPDLKEKYREVFVDLENRGIIEEIPFTNSDSSPQHPIFYLPHRPVVRDESQTTKIRPVFDASAKGENGVSLNDCMEIGPKMTPDLVQILLRFRRWKFGLSADIQKTFLQIELEEIDRDVHRFLLFDVQNQVRHMRFKRVTFGNASSPFLLNAVIRLHLARFAKDHTVKELETNLYVDDWLSGSDSEGELLHMMARSTEIMAQGGFPLTKWTSNSPKLREDLKKSFDYDGSQSQKVLGLAWNPVSDCFHFETKQQVGEMYSKRSLLGLVAKQFDPLGLLTPFTVSLKILFQEVWRNGFHWDELLPSEFQNEINSWIAGLEEINNWRIPRRMTSLGWQEVRNVELIVFVDASEKAYGTCIYLANKEDCGVHRRLVTSKVRVAPLKKVTLPRLELLAALLGARLLRFVTETLELPDDTRYTCWTDSKIALAWIQGDPYRWKQFVRNRVEEIQQLTNPSQWKHCPGKENPADLLTRGVRASVLMGSTVWLNGSSGLAEDTQPLPETSVMAEFELEDCRVEEEQPKPVCSVAVETSTTLIEYERFSSFGKLLRVTALVLRFIGKLKAAKNQAINRSVDEEFLKSKCFIVKDLQRRHYSTEIADLRKHGQVSRHSSLLPLSPFLDSDSLIRIQGRLGQATGLAYDEKHPVILPRCHVSFLLVRAQHELLKHAGVGTLINSLRCQYWIIAVRNMAKSVVRQCVQCRRYDGRPLDQVTAPLPEDRVTRAPPFSVTGIDCAGPLYCSDTGVRKMYIVLFTCAVTRALHLEMVTSLSLDDFILAFRRFVSRRALPSIIYSDNARTFKAASAVLQARLGKEIVCWKNICPLSPNWGGWWERLVRSVKSALRKSLGKQSVTKTELETLLTEVEACVNSRPLMYVSETGNVLTPSHFLIGRGTPLTSVELGNFELTVNLSSRHEFEESLTEHFWQVWKDEYLRNLPPITARGGSCKTDTSLEVGSLVLIKDEKMPRMLWSLGRVAKLFKGIDGRVRAVQLDTQNGSLVRSIKHLCLMEDRNCDPIDTDISDPNKCNLAVLSPEKSAARHSEATIPKPTHAEISSKQSTLTQDERNVD